MVLLNSMLFSDEVPPTSAPVLNNHRREPSMSTPRSNTPGTGLPRRRNGKEQACEPCRKAKIACDHTLPVCTRCKRRKITDKCVYMSAPMTKINDPSMSHLNRRQSEPIQPQPIQQSSFPLTPTTGSSTVVSPDGLNNSHGYSAPAPPANSALFALGRSTSANSVIPQPRTARDKEASLTLASLGSKTNAFFGPTSFSAVFAENRENLGGTINDDIPITNERVPYIHSDESLSAQMYMLLAGKTELEQGGPRIMLGARVIAALPDQNTCNFLLEYYFEKCYDNRAYKRITMAICASFWNTFGNEMREPRCMDDMEKISNAIYKNITTPLEESEDWETYVASFTGTNMRWESIGCVFAGLSSALLSLPERDGFFTTQRGSRTDRKHFAVELKDCLQACMSLSNYMDFLNIIMVAITCRNMFLQTVLSGDTSLICWRQLGDLVSATTALGLHRQSFPRVTFLTELKKHIFGVVFGIDKSASLLTGRPPALSYRYTRFEPPLDLNDDVVIRGGEELRRAIEKLDVNGWNTEGAINTATYNRGRVMLSIDLNEVLELSLGNPSDATSERIEALIARLEATYASFPEGIKLNLHGPDPGPDWAWIYRLCLRLDVLEYRLILERIAHKNGYRNGQSMVDCAREMLEHVVLLWVQRDRFVEKHCDYDWMLMCWGVPSSGVLCVELLNQIKQPPGTEYELKLPRSEIVQNLSLLIGFLEWVRPAAGNYLLCRRMSLLIKRILDQILNPSPPVSNPNPNTNNNHLPPPSQDSTMHDGHSNFDTASSNGMVGLGVGPYDVQFDQDASWEEGLGDLDWLNAVDWSRGPWRLDLGGQDVPASRWN